MSASTFRHDAAIFSSPEEMCASVVPFLDEAVESGIPAFVRLEDDLAAMVREAVARPDAVGFVSGASQPNPLRAIQEMNEAVMAQLETGAEEIRLIGCVPHASRTTPQAWEQWARYEAAYNRMYAGLPLWGICCYDVPPPEHALDDVLATHTRLRAEDGSWRQSSEYVDPDRWLAQRAAASVERLDEGAPAFELTGPHLSQAREAVARLAVEAGLAADRVDDLVLAVNEVVTNAFLHGCPPVTLRGWRSAEGVLLTVHDRGPGVADALAGMTPPSDDRSLGGRGVRLARLCTDLMTLRQDADGFTVRMASWTP